MLKTFTSEFTFTCYYCKLCIAVTSHKIPDFCQNMRLILLLACVAVVADAFVTRNGAFMKPPMRRNLFNNPFSSKKGVDPVDKQSGGMFGGKGGMEGLMGMVKEAEKIKNELESQSVTAQDRTGGVTVTFNGMQTPQRVKISDSMLSLGAEGLSEVITNVLIEAHKMSNEKMNSNMMGLMGGLGLPNV